MLLPLGVLPRSTVQYVSEPPTYGCLPSLGFLSAVRSVMPWAVTGTEKKRKHNIINSLSLDPAELERFNFVRYVIGSAAVRVKEAERIADSEVPTASSGKSPTDSHQTERTGKAVAKWLEAGGYLQHDLKSANAAQDMQVPRSHLLAWVKAQGYDSFTQWITGLRIEEAKRLLDEHPDWSIDAVADHCGISRSHFHTVFKKETGHSPAEYLVTFEK